MFNKVTLFGREIVLVAPSEKDKIVEHLAVQKVRSVYFCNVHMLMLSQENQQLAEAMDRADVIFADGVPVAWLQSRVSKEPCEVVRGYEVLQGLCSLPANLAGNVGFLGSSPHVIDHLVKNIAVRNPKLNIAFRSSPSMVDGELISSPEEIEFIRAAKLDWLFVGLGCPKQELWIDRYAGELNCTLLGVGAAFDWLAGTTRKPPGWMEKSGLGWLYRLVQNPRRMAHRYVIYNSKFIVSAIKLLINRRFSKPT